jgi:hypothetical protein
MKDIPLIDELRAIRRRLAEEQELDMDRYAEMLREVARTSPGEYVTEPILFPLRRRGEEDLPHPNGL